MSNKLCTLPSVSLEGAVLGLDAITPADPPP